MSFPFLNCSGPKKMAIDSTAQDRETVDNFRDILDEAKLQGAILIYDLNRDRYFSNDFTKASEGQLPASTFKIINSLIALDNQIVENDSTLIKWDGEKRYLKVWEQDLLFRDAFRYSCVPCYQEIARKIGVDRMNMYTRSIDYGQMDINESTIDQFWLRGSSLITPFEQITILNKLYHNQLPFSERTQTMVKEMMVLHHHKQTYLRGKTGWSVDNDHNNGWFVGWLTAKKGVYFFAVNVSPKEGYNMKQFSADRKNIAISALNALGIVYENPFTSKD
ncbi:class D beta-lactamase [Prolixibacteraceae bacterium]|nr:class D beta-lactamase [Prolixibacteraceae bacterium]